uniref:(California timema) hypothetical protein n=1 Tax=Timema californicum TaxID=61474 RepID=A0A7R9J907_TIMCA|nr:unnamed protein product [Timema californicum]
MHGSEGNTGPSSPGSRLAVTSSCHYMAHEKLSYAFSVWRMEGDWNGGGHVTSSCHYMAHERLSYAFSVWRMEGDWNGGGHV